MTLRVRRIIYIISILIFLLAAPVVLLYTTGYNYNFKRGNFLETSVILVDALPKDAHFSLDGKPYTNSLPARVSNLKPKDYDVMINRDGYYPWQKKLTIDSGATVYATNIFLPKKSSPEHIFNGAIAQSLYLERGNQFIFVTKNKDNVQLVLFDVASTHTKTLTDHLTTNAPRLILSPNEKYLIVETPSRTLVINLGKITPPHTLQGAHGPLRNLVFEDGNDFVVYGLDGGAVVQHNLITDEQTVLQTIGKENFLIANGYLYWTATVANQPFALLRRPLVSSGMAPQAIFNPPSGRYAITPIGQNILLLEINTQTFTLVDGKTFNEIDNGQMSGELPPNANAWIYWNDSEVWIRDIKNNATALITRIGEPVVKAAELKKEPYVLYATHAALTLIEEDNRDIKNIYPLANLADIQDFFSKDDKTVYITTNDGLYSLAIQ